MFRFCWLFPFCLKGTTKLKEAFPKYNVVKALLFVLCVWLMQILCLLGPCPPWPAWSSPRVGPSSTTPTMKTLVWGQCSSQKQLQFCSECCLLVDIQHGLYNRSVCVCVSHSQTSRCVSGYPAPNLISYDRDLIFNLFQNKSININYTSVISSIFTSILYYRLSADNEIIANNTMPNCFHWLNKLSIHTLIQ